MSLLDVMRVSPFETFRPSGLHRDEMHSYAYAQIARITGMNTAPKPPRPGVHSNAYSHLWSHAMTTRRCSISRPVGVSLLDNSPRLKPGACALRHSSNTGRSDDRLASFWKGENDDINQFVFAIRNGVAHGTLTFSGLQLDISGRTELLKNLADEVLLNTDRLFTAWVEEEIARRIPDPS